MVDGVDPAAAPATRGRDAAAAGAGRRGASPTSTDGRPAGRRRPDARRAPASRSPSTTVDRPARNTAADAIADAAARLAGELRAAGRPARVEVGGGPVLNRQANQAVQEDLQRAETISLPLTLVVLVFVFGGLVAAGLPVLAAVVSVAAAMGVLLGFSTFTDVDPNGVTVVTLLGLGLSVDYGLLLVARYREELSGGVTPPEAVARAWATAGRTILFSALTVAAALAGLLMFDLPRATALGAAGVLDRAWSAMLAALTFTAALIGLTAPLGQAVRRRADAGRRRRTSAAPPTSGASSPGCPGWCSAARCWSRCGRPPRCCAAGIPLLTGTVKLPGARGLPRAASSRRRSPTTLGDRFGLTPDAGGTVVARTDPAALDAWAGRLGRPTRPWPRSGRPGRRRRVVRGRLRRARRPAGPGRPGPGHRMRADRPPGGESWVTGDAAVLVDLLGLIERGLPWRGRHHPAGDDGAAVRDDRLAGGAGQGDPGQRGLARRHLRRLTAVFEHGFASRPARHADRRRRSTRSSS